MFKKKEPEFDPTSLGMKWVEGIKLVPRIEEMLVEFLADLPSKRSSLVGVVLDPIGFYHLKKEVGATNDNFTVKGLPVLLGAVNSGLGFVFRGDIAPAMLAEQMLQIKEHNEEMARAIKNAIESGNIVVVNPPPPSDDPDDEDKETIH